MPPEHLQHLAASSRILRLVPHWPDRYANQTDHCFFGGNLVQDYAHEQAVVDGVNVGYDVYRIETKITKDGAKLAREPGIFVPHRDRRTKGKKYKELDDDLTYTANQLDRDVVSENQIRLVMRTFKDKLPEIFPGRTEVPKTLVFAKTDLHAEDNCSHHPRRVR